MTDKELVLKDNIELSPLHGLKNRFAPIPRPYVDIIRTESSTEIKRVRSYDA